MYCRLTTTDSSSSESEGDSKKGTQACKKVPETLSCGDRETSATLSSDAKVPEVKSKVTKKKPSVKGSSSSGSDSDSDDSTTDSASDKKLARKGTQKKDLNSSDSSSSSSSSNSSSSSSDSSSSDSESTSSDSESTTSSSESESEAEITPISGKVPVGRGVASSKSRANTGVASIPKEEMQVTKKRKTSESGAAVVTAVVSTHPTDDVQVSAKVRNIQKNGNGKPPRNVNERFSRIKPQNIPAEQLLDNGYEAKGGVTNDYGNRAHQDLIVTRGAGFRKEKNKKKRGSYRGGEITLQSHSIKFTD
ncbi:SRP40, C-terminal domain-containing protein [Suillus discolor]|uniref:SRP40, C-terminal domain-containing protein n=1 Tax=Suillus discolor TaxID=1912936 RepID=A0A9P7FH33_9AGAM|nr:SRP40, C-terminal domain-containing protein [Suillus discolor]KAG2116531.1 SRP40, C-terminal domain-containing protein [Suillus discolor]